MNEEKIMDQSQLAQDLSEKIPYEMAKHFLVKPLDPIMVKKEFTNPVTNNEAVKDENGVEAVDFEDTKTEVKEVESDFRKGVVLKIPKEYIAYSKPADGREPYMLDIKIGDIVLYRSVNARWFDLLKDTQLIDTYGIIAVERGNN